MISLLKEQPSPSLTLDQFREQVEKEFCQGNGIDPALFAAAVQVRSDIEVDAAGDPITPIHDALNWKYTRFGYQARESFYAALLSNEDESCWQVKMSKPRIDRRNKTI